MKKTFAFCLFLALALSLCTLANAEKPGDTVSIPIHFSNTDACQVTVAVSYDKNIFELVSLTGNGWQAGTYLANASLSPLASGKIGSLTLKIKNGAPAGTYTIGASIREAWTIDETKASCSVSGGSVKVEGEAPACIHVNIEWKETSAATCIKDGAENKFCKDCGADLKETRVIPAKGHDSGKWETKTEPACETEGSRELKCTVCKKVLKTEPIPAKGHDDGKWETKTKPACEAEGIRELKCTVCKKVLKTEPISATGHDKGRWVVIRKATNKAEGERQLKCTKCGYVLKTETLPIVTVTYWHNTACSIGPRFRDVSNVTEKWYMFTPLDLSKPGTQTLDLIAGNMHKVGTVEINITESSVTVQYFLIKGITVKNEFFTLLPDLTSAADVEPENLNGYEFGREISIADDLNGDMKVLLFVCNDLSYSTDSAKPERFFSTGEDYKKLVEEQKTIMD